MYSYVPSGSRLFAHIVQSSSVSIAAMYLDLVDKMLALWRWMAMSAVLLHPGLK